jgi:hypothetical protein
VKTICTGIGGRGCACPSHVAARIKSREYARHARAKLLEEKLKTATRCPKRQGKFECGGPLRIDTNGNGMTVVTCEWCERQKRGICRDCPKPVYGKRARRCRECANKAIRESEREWFERNRDTELAKYREYYNQPEVRAARNEYKRQWRKANPEKVRAQKKRYVQRHSGKASSWYEKYHARYRKKHRLHYRELQNTKSAIAREGRKPPACRKCGKKTGWTPVPGPKPGRPWSLCNQCVFPGDRKTRRRVRREAARRLTADPGFDRPPKPVKVLRPRAGAVRGPGFERLCITPGCETVVTHRKKKCTKCRERDRQLAEQRLASQRGRGRRVDLERRNRVA